MLKNNYFNYVGSGEHYYFLLYLLSFATEQYKDEDPMLSECAKELIRYILGMNKTEKIIVTDIYEETVIVNHNKYIKIREDLVPHIEESEKKDYYFVCFNPSDGCSTSTNEELHEMHLSIKKVKEICSKYQSKNLIFLQFVQYLDEQEREIQITLQTPIEQWNETDYRYFTLHLIEDSIVDMSRMIRAWEVCYGLWEDLQYTHSLYWYYISDDELKSMGIRNHIKQIYLYTHLNTINICFEPFKDNNQYVKKLQTFLNDICPMPITFDINNYKEKIQYAESIMDRLVAKFRL